MSSVALFYVRCASWHHPPSHHSESAHARMCWYGYARTYCARGGACLPPFVYGKPEDRPGLTGVIGSQRARPQWKRPPPGSNHGKVFGRGGPFLSAAQRCGRLVSPDSRANLASRRGRRRSPARRVRIAGREVRAWSTPAPCTACHPDARRGYRRETPHQLRVHACNVRSPLAHTSEQL